MSHHPSVSADPQRILIVDGDHRVRDCLADLLGLAAGARVVGTTSQPGETLDAIDRLDPAVVVIDPYLPDLDTGLALIGAVRSSARDVRIVATCREDGFDDLALAAGADSCVHRDADPVAFCEAVAVAARLDASRGSP
jgi:DNA-binding NarL/FixJ family response regulator